MSFVTIGMIAQHARKTPQAVRDALRAAGYSPEKFPGVRGYRLQAEDATHFGNLAGEHRGKPLETHRGGATITRAAEVSADSFAERKRPVFQRCARSERDGIRAA